MDRQYSVKKEFTSAGHHLEYLSDSYSQRIILLDRVGNTDLIIQQLKNISSKEKAGKIIAYAREPEKSSFEEHGFVQEGIIKGYFRGENAFCYSYFSDLQRRYNSRIVEEDKIIENTLSAVYKETPLSEFKNYVIRTALTSEAKALAQFLGDNFTSYPTPVHDPVYIKEIMREQALFKIALHHDEIICAASADRKTDLLNAEITDCVTHPDFRGKGLTGHLIHLLEQDLIASGYITLYSLARAISPPINRALRKNGFEYGGRLINNCCIMGNIEDMNIWVKTTH
ncbi:beta-lysine acetyltransferase [hydrocarbon metagenome]|uniref:Beta-lysine acetyltransferase n=1 Tax=hydrocarbon metagenome TaxID=938273 RepID=A0A0W8E305_9ZZZZ